MLNRDRLKKITESMKCEGIPQLLLTGTENFKYLTGIDPFALERVCVLLIQWDGTVEAFASDVIRLHIDEGICIHEHTDSDNPYGDLANAVSKGVIGIDKDWSAGHLMGLMEERPDLIPVNADKVLTRARMLKSRQEIEILKKSSAINDQVIAELVDVISSNPKLSEKKLSEMANVSFVKRGADKNPWFQEVCFGANAADPHHIPDCVSVLHSGDAILFDLCAPYKNYWCDMSRTVFYCECSEEHRRAYETVRIAQQKAIDCVRPGVTICEVYDACVPILHEAGYCYKGRIGHGIGISVHEYPNIAPNVDCVLEPGMVFTLEPGVYLEGDIGIRIEDTILVTEDGCEVLNHYPKELTIIGE